MMSKKLEKLMHESAKVALDEGYIFGDEGKGFEELIWPVQEV